MITIQCYTFLGYFQRLLATLFSKSAHISLVYISKHLPFKFHRNPSILRHRLPIFETMKGQLRSLIIYLSFTNTRLEIRLIKKKLDWRKLKLLQWLTFTLFTSTLTLNLWNSDEDMTIQTCYNNICKFSNKHLS